MVKFLQLLSHPFSDLGMAVAVQVHPPGTNPIEKPLADVCYERAAFGSDNRQRRLRRLHLRIWMPENCLISFRPVHVPSAPV